MSGYGSELSTTPVSGGSRSPSLRPKRLEEMLQFSDAGLSRPSSTTSNPSNIPSRDLQLPDHVLQTPRSRPRAGTLPASFQNNANGFAPANDQLSSAFGAGVFSSGTAWPPQTPPGAVRSHSQLETIRSPGSSAGAYEQPDALRTLDYLGLDDNPSPVSGLAPFSDRELSVGSSLLLAHTRVRSNTVATFPRPREGEPFKRGSPLPPPSSLAAQLEGSPAGDFFNVTAEDSGSSYHRSNESADSNRLLYSTDDHPSQNGHSSHLGSAMESPNRARARTIGIFDGDHRETILRRRAGTASGLTPNSMGSGLGTSSGDSTPLLGVTRGLRAMSLAQDQPSPWGAPSSGAHTPELGSLALATPTTSTYPTPTSQTYTHSQQQPTRSLWIGNLDPSITPAELQNVFSPYGAIESLRLIHEKECGFVNFVSVNDAVRAKDDVLNRLGGHLNSHSPVVRIGFGKAEAAAPTPYSLGRGYATAGGFNAQSGANASEMTQSSPTRALWIGSIPNTTTPSQLLHIFSPFGAIESARILTHKSCGFINFERLDDAIAARKALNGRELLGADVGACRIGFAKVPTKLVASAQPSASPSPVPGHFPFADTTNTHPLAALRQMAGANGVPLERQVSEGSLQDYRSNLVVGAIVNGANGGSSPNGGSPPTLQTFEGADEQIVTATASVQELELLMRQLSGDSPETEEHVRAVAVERPPVSYYSTIPTAALTDPRIATRYSNVDAPRLRDIRKRLDSGLSNDEVDELAYSLVDECVGLASDYLGNVCIQSAYTRASIGPRMAMLDKIGPHLAAIGTHKNGTWAVQKMIASAQTEQEFAVIQQNLQPYAPPLLLDQFGNYVLQGCSRFPERLSEFMFVAMVDRCWEIGSGRFGARSMRQVLESAGTSSLQIKRVALAIVLNSIPLATSANGALLVTWLLDNSNLAGRFSLLAARFAPHLAHLCTHKLSSVAVLKIVNQQFDRSAAQAIIQPLLADEPKMLEEIIADQMHGTQTVIKILNCAFLEPADRDKLTQKARAIVQQLKVQTIPGYRALLDQLGIEYQGAMPQPAYAQPQQQWAPAQSGYPFYCYEQQLNPPSYLSPGAYPSPNFYSQHASAQLGPVGSNYGGYNNRAPSGGRPGAAYSPFTPPSPSLASPAIGATPSSPMSTGGRVAGSIGSPDPFQRLRMGGADNFNPAFSSNSSGRGRGWMGAYEHINNNGAY